MRSLSRMRAQMVRRVMGAFGRPAIPQMLSSQAKQVSYTEILAYPEKPSSQIQNSDGTFKFMIGYDYLGDPDVTLGG